MWYENLVGDTQDNWDMSYIVLFDVEYSGECREGGIERDRGKGRRGGEEREERREKRRRKGKEEEEEERGGCGRKEQPQTGSLTDGQASNNLSHSFCSTQNPKSVEQDLNENRKMQSFKNPYLSLASLSQLLSQMTGRGH